MAARRAGFGRSGFRAGGNVGCGLGKGGRGSLFRNCYYMMLAAMSVMLLKASYILPDVASSAALTSE